MNYISDLINDFYTVYGLVFAQVIKNNVKDILHITSINDENR